MGSPLPPNFSAASAGGMMGGGNNLQASLDALTRSINRLTNPAGTGVNAGGGVPWVGNLGASAPSFPRPANPFTFSMQGPAMAASQGGVPWMGGNGPNGMGGSGVYGPMNTGSFPRPLNPFSPQGPNRGYGPGNVYPYGGGPSSFGGPAGPYSPVGGGGGPVNNTTPYGPQPNQPSTFQTATTAMWNRSYKIAGQTITPGGSMMGNLGAAVSLIGKAGMANLPTQSSMSNYVFSTSLASGSNQTFAQTSYQARFNAVGVGTRNQNAIALNGPDALAGQSILNATAGQAGTTVPNASMQSLMGGQAMAGFLNPGLGAKGSASLMGALYSPQVSRNMQMLGYGVTPRQLGGGNFRNFGSIAQGMMQTWYGSGTAPMKNLVAGLSPNGGHVNLDLQQAGFNQQQIAQLTPMLEAQNKLRLQGMGTGKINTLFNQARDNNAGAQQTLARDLHTNITDVQHMQDVTATSTGRQSQNFSSFSAGLATATDSLASFNNMLTSLLNNPAGRALAYGQGAGAGVKSFSSGMQMGIGSSLVTAAMARRAASAGRTAATAAAARTGAGGAGAGTLGRAAAATGSAALSVGVPFTALHAVDEADPKLVRHNGFGSGAFAAPANWISNAMNSITGGIGGMVQNIFGGAASPSQSNTKQSKNKGGQVGGSVSGAAVHAVHNAEQEVGVPYLWGGEQPGVGFDCSGLVQWAYRQAGINLPRRSQEQWSALQRRAINAKDAQEGDIVFAAGSDGSANAPGHEALMISRSSIIEAATTGTNIRIRGYNPGEWSHVARPAGSLKGAGGPAGSGKSGQGNGGTGASNTMGSSLAGNSGMGISTSGVGFSESGAYGGYSESGSLAGGGPGAASGGMPYSSTGGGRTGNTSGSGSGGGPGGLGKVKGQGGSREANKELMKKLAAAYGWTGGQWQALNTLEMHEAGWDNHAQNPRSTAYGIGQFLDTTWATVGGHKTSDPRLQEEYMLKYIKQRYHTPEAAWAQYYNHPGGIGWYGHGTLGAAPGWSVVGEHGPEMVKMHGGETVVSAGQTESLRKSGVGGGGGVNLNFGESSIVINMPNGGSTDVGSQGRLIAREMVRWLAREDIYNTIADGQKN